MGQSYPKSPPQSTEPPIEKVLGRLDGVRKTGTGWQARCPAHDDRQASLSISLAKDGETVLLNCHAGTGCDLGDVLQRIDLEKKDLFPRRLHANPNGSNPKRTIAAEYDYRKDGRLVFQVVRLEPKGFSQRRPDGNGGWVYNLRGIEPCLYHHDEIVASDDMVVLCEGEKDVDRLRGLGLIATTSPMGAGKWRPQYTATLAGREMVILPDNDDPGRKHAAEAADELTAAGCTVKIVELPGVDEKGDVSDWFDLGFTVDDLVELVREVPVWDPEKVSAAPSEGVAAERNPLFITARELAEQTPAETRWIAKPWVAENAITEVSGKIKAAGKTTWVLAMCRAIIDGTDFMGIPTTKGAVVFLTEQPAPSFREALERAGLLECDDLHILQWHRTSGMSWEHVVIMARQQASAIGASMLVVDTLAQFAGLKGDTENNAGAALEALAPIQLAIADGVGVLLTRHDRKGGGEVGDSARGSSAFGGVVDVVLQIQRGEGNTRPTIRVINALSRFDATPDQLMIELTDTGYVALGDKGAVAADEARNAIRNVAPTSEAEAATEPELLEAAEVKRTAGQEAIRALVDANVLTRTGEGKRGSPYRYWRYDEKVSAASPVDAAERNGHAQGRDGDSGEKVSAATIPLRAAERNGHYGGLEFGDVLLVGGESGVDRHTA